MSRAGKLTKSPTLLTALLSVAAIAGYVTYRFTTGAGAPAATGAAAEMAGQQEAHEPGADAAAAPRLADALPDVTLNDLAGMPTALASFQGKPLLINFWATWCAPCLREIPMLKTFHDEHAGIDVIGIAVDRLDPVLEYAEEMQFNYPVLVGQSDGMNAMAAFRNDAGAMPFSVLTDAAGAVLVTHAGELHAEHLEAFAATLGALAAGDIDRAGARRQLAGI